MRGIETQRLYLRGFQAEDEEWFYYLGQKNRSHLARHESHKIVMEIQGLEDAQAAVRNPTAEWVARCGMRREGHFRQSRTNKVTILLTGAHIGFLC